MLYLDMVQVTNIMRAAYKRSRRDHLILLLSFQHGLRVSEVANLQLADVADGILHVQRVKKSLETTQPLMPSPNVLFNEPLALQAWLEERPQVGEALFPSRKGGMALDPDSVSRLATQYMELAHVPADLAHHHSLKHALASMLIRSGVDLAYVKQALGHRSISSTILYTHITDSEATAKATEAIQKSLGGKQ